MAAAFAARSDLLPTLVLAAAENMDLAVREQRPELAIHELHQEMPWLSWPKDAAERMLDAALEESASDRGRILYAAALELTAWWPVDAATFERVWAAAVMPDWSAVRDRICAPVPWHEWHKREACRRWRTRRAEVRRQARIVAELAARDEGIRAGKDIPALAWLAQVRFGMADALVTDESLSPGARLRAALGPDVASAAEEGFKALVLSGPVPTPTDIAGWNVVNEHPWSSYAFLAGADLLLGDAAELPPLWPETLASLACLALNCHTRTKEGNVSRPDERPWVARVIEAHPSEMTGAMRALLTKQLRAAKEHVTGLWETCRQDGFRPVRSVLVPELLRIVNPRQPHLFTLLVQAGCEVCNRSELLSIAEEHLAAPSLGSDERWPWLHLAWRLDPTRHDEEVRRVAGSDQTCLWELMEGAGDGLDDRNRLPLPLGVTQRVTMVELAGAVFPPVPPPEAAYGSRHPHEGAEFVWRQLDHIAAIPDAEAEVALRCLAEEPALAAHRRRILHVLATWHKAERQRASQTPTLERVIEALRGGCPASGPDLLAFVAEHLRSLDEELRTTQDQMWQPFWNLDACGRPHEPRPENVCRNYIATLLRSRFERVGLSQETEVRHAGETRCDIVVASLERSLPVEVKRDAHSELWTAWRDQLAAKYAIDPKADGFGIYLVLWFGRKLPRPPEGSAKPRTSQECARMLNRLIDEAGHGRLRAIVLDVSPK